MELLPPEPENVNVTIRVKDDSGNYLTATIKEISVTGDTVGTSTPKEPLVITKSQNSVITYYALPAISQRYNIANQEVVFDSNKTVEIVCSYIPFEMMVLIICKSKVMVLNILYLGLVMSNLINGLMI